MTRANALVQPIHDRMPAILGPRAYGQWLGTDITDAEDLTQLIVPFSPEDREAYPVDRTVNNPRNEGAVCVERGNDWDAAPSPTAFDIPRSTVHNLNNISSNCAA